MASALFATPAAGMALLRFMDRSTLTFITVSAFSLSTRLISTAVVTRLATNLTVAPNFAITVTASVFELFALFTLIAAIGLFLRRVSKSLILTAWLPGVAFCLVGTLLTLVSLGLTIHYAKRNLLEASLQDDARELATVGLTIAVLGLVPQITIYVLIWPRTKLSDVYSVEKQSDRPSFAHSEKHRSVAVHLSPLRPNFLKSTTARRVLQPVSSKTRLVLGSPRDSRSMHSRAGSLTTSEATRANSDFENWDTSAVEAFDNPFAQKTFLEPIPGSRPASPANPLDGPFGGGMAAPNEIPLPESPPHPSALDCGASFRTFRRPSEHEDSYYHPLFRSESPAPPPPVSPGTVITASPFAGQIVSQELIVPRMLHSAASSRPASPGLLSPVRSQAGSIRSFRTVPTSPPERSGSLSPVEPVHLAPPQVMSPVSPVSPV